MTCQHEEGVVIAIRAEKGKPTTGTVICNDCQQHFELGDQPGDMHLLDSLGNDWETGE